MTTRLLKIGHGGLTILSYVLAFGCLAGCGGAFVIGGVSGGGGGSDPDDGGGGGGDAAEDEILILFINQSDVGVDTEFYATNDVLQDASEELFVPAYRITMDIGLFSTGSLAAGESAEITYPCTDTTMIGTEGGTFKDERFGTPLATGEPRILQRRLGSFDCGNTIIFAYTGTSEDDYNAAPPVVDSR